MSLEKNHKIPKDDYVISSIDGNSIMKSNYQVILLDVRTKEEFIDQRIPNSILLPVDEILYLVNLLYPDKDSIYIIYCRSGIRSAYARKVMKHLGYHHVYDMGGIIDWPYEKISG